MSKLDFNCLVCGSEFSRFPSEVKRGKNKTCSKACLGKLQSGERNPFFGKRHTDNSKADISQSRKGQCRGNQNARGYRHTVEARRLIGQASVYLWREVRGVIPTKEGYFTDYQRRVLLGDHCLNCGSRERLELDHIVPRCFGGTNDDSNAQTLCKYCNIQKFYKNDLPRHLSTKTQSESNAVNCWNISGNRDNQQPSSGGNALEGSTTRDRGYGKSYASNIPTSAVLEESLSSR